MRALHRERALRSSLLAALLSAWAGVPALGQTAVDPPRPPVSRTRVGLALGGGGARGLAHIGVLLWLDEHRIPVDVIGGTSMGGLVGAAFATGMTPAEIRTLVGSIDWATVLAPETPFPSKTFRRKEDTRAYPSQLRFGLKGGVKLPTALSPGQRAELLFARVAAPFGSDVDFDALPTPFRCVATDVRNAEVVVFDSGSLALALRATMAMPGVFSPVETGDRLLVDGGLVDNLPADVVRQTGRADRIVAVDVGADLAIARTGDTVFAVLGQALDGVMRSGARRALASARADLLLVPSLKDFQTTDFGRADELIRKGHEAAEAQADALLQYAVSEADFAMWAAARQARRPGATLVPSRISVEQVSPAEAARIVRRLAPRHLNRPLDSTRLDADLLALTGDGRYESAAYRIDRSLGPTELVVSVKAARSGPPFLLAALDLENTRTSNVGAAIRGRLLAFDVLGAGSEARVELATGNTLEAFGELQRPFGRTGLFIAPRAYVFRRDTPVFRDDSYAAEYREYESGAAIDLGFATSHRFESRLGYTVEHLRRDVRIGDSALPSVKGPQRFTSLQVVFDGQNGPTLPERGVYLKADLRRYFEVPDIRSADGSVAGDPDGLWSGRGTVSVFSPIGRRGRLLLRGAGGSSFGKTTTVNAFTLGGPFDLGAYYPSELRGSNVAVANVGYFHEISRYVEGAIGRFYAGAWLDEGTTFERWGDATFRTNVSAGLLLDSPIGPIFAGASVGRDGRYRVYFSLGRFLPR